MQTISCNNSPLKVTRTLFEALQAIRLPDRPCLVWVDALCINQQDNDERTIQVKRMSQIYHEAANVFIWLRSSTPTTSLAVDFIRRLATRKSSFRKLNPSSLTFPLEELEATGLPTPEDPQWEALDEFMNHWWFCRV